MMKRSRKYDDKKLFWLKAAKEFALFLAIAFVIFRFVIGISFVSGESMDPTLKNHTPVIYWRLTNTYDRGEIVSVRFPSGEYYVKRVVAVAGDTVDIVDGKLLINGVPEEGAYVYGVTEKQIASQQEESSVTYPITIAPGQIFVLGDHREVSVDSRAFGPVSTSQVRGRLLFVH